MFLNDKLMENMTPKSFMFGTEMRRMELMEYL